MRDRPNDPHGGILIAAKKHLHLTDIKVSSHLETMSATFKADKKNVHIAVFYRPPNKVDEEYLRHVREEFNTLKLMAKKNILIIAGDFNLTDIDWKHLSISSNQYSSGVNQTFLDIVSDFPTPRKTILKKDLDRYKRLQKEVQYLTRKADKTYLTKDLSGNLREDSKKFFSYIKSKGQESSGAAPLKNKDGFLQSNSKAKANILNDQFVSVFTREYKTNMPDKGPRLTPTMDKIKVDWKGVHKLLLNLNTHKACGPDEISSFILKTAANELAPALAKLFQHSINSGEADWREASEVPLFKKGDRHQAAKYRPVSLTSITCKLLEHIVNSSVMTHFDKQDVLCDNQHGFRKRRSCESQFLTTIQEIASTAAKGKQVDIILLACCRSLITTGVRGNTKMWIKSFLSHRTQQVVLDGAKSETVDVLSGVPQGTDPAHCCFWHILMTSQNPSRHHPPNYLLMIVCCSRPLVTILTDRNSRRT
ncbi:uncharacterized protein LOC128552706 [Mercenaria mercenaria]|uniref:uncharacterized protein LOC128552706 n=1 Tax=Mercenaria mercenaria TaxID=6596 RepID=UPI00234F46B8|nr:uncharacterized protein LOC128552706 [Mercenaria mercenaria]